MRHRAIVEVDSDDRSCAVPSTHDGIGRLVIFPGHPLLRIRRVQRLFPGNTWKPDDLIDELASAAGLPEPRTLVAR